MDINDLKKRLEKIPAKVVIRSQRAYDIALAEFVALKQLEKENEARKKPLLDSANETVRQIKAIFRPFENNLESILSEYHVELNKYANAVEAERIKKLESINTDKRLKNVETIVALREEAGERASSTMRIKKVVIDDESKIPDEFWIVDQVALRKALIIGQHVDGARLVEELTVTA